MVKEVLTRNFHLLPDNKGGGVIYCYNFKLAKKLNRLLGTYVDYKFQEGEEGIFKFGSGKVAAVLATLGL